MSKRYFSIVKSRVGDGVSDIVEDIFEEEKYIDSCIGERGDIEIAVYEFESSEDSESFRREVIFDLQQCGIYFKVRAMSDPNYDVHDVMMDFLSNE